MTLIYQAITLIIVLLIVWYMFRERKLKEQIEAALVLLPLILRLCAWPQPVSADAGSATTSCPLASNCWARLSISL